jgi:hypothetical protein
MAFFWWQHAVRVMALCVVVCIATYSFATARFIRAHQRDDNFAWTAQKGRHFKTWWLSSWHERMRCAPNKNCFFLTDITGCISGQLRRVASFFAI